MIDCGILTFQYAHNYGALLQAYALKTFLNSNHIETEIINYANLQAKEMYSFFPSRINGGVDFLRKGKRCFLRARQYFLMKKFAQNYMEYDITQPFSEQKAISGKYKSILVGSDQVWNIQLTDNDMTYFLESVKCENSISYAASFGSSELIESLPMRCVNLLKKFDSISVREAEARNKLIQIIEKNVSLVVDPVFLLSLDDWKKLEQKPKSIRKRYCCLVMLRDDSKLIERCKKYADEKNIEIISIHPMAWKQTCGRQLYDVGPQEFLWLIDHADCIVTNSFHATAFSVIFRKKIITSSIAKGNDRISSLIQMVSGVNTFDSSELIDTNGFHSGLIENKINESKNYLLENLLQIN